MGIPITIPGLNEFIDEIPDSSLILVQGSIDPIYTIFIQQLATIAVNEKKPVNYITSRAIEEVQQQLHYFQDNGTEFPIVEERSHRHWQDYITDNGVTIIDSFSYLNIERPLADVRQIMEEFLKLCNRRNAIIFLTLERGMLDEQIEITCGHLADGVFNFQTMDTNVGIRRYIRIPKWIHGKSFDENIYYHFDGKRILIDLRSRVR